VPAVMAVTEMIVVSYEDRASLKEEHQGNDGCE
jgi:hypothetical protein